MSATASKNSRHIQVGCLIFGSNVSTSLKVVTVLLKKKWGGGKEKKKENTPLDIFIAIQNFQ